MLETHKGALLQTRHAARSIHPIVSLVSLGLVTLASQPCPAGSRRSIVRRQKRVCNLCPLASTHRALVSFWRLPQISGLTPSSGSLKMIGRHAYVIHRLVFCSHSQVTRPLQGSEYIVLQGGGGGTSPATTSALRSSTSTPTLELSSESLRHLQFGPVGRILLLLSRINIPREDVFGKVAQCADKFSCWQFLRPTPSRHPLCRTA